MMISTPRFMGGCSGKAASGGQETEEADMLKRNRIPHKLDPLLLMTLLVTLSVFMTTAVDAADASFFSNPNLPDLINGDVTLAEVGHRGADIHMSFQTPVNNERLESRDASLNVPVADLFLSVRIPW